MRRILGTFALAAALCAPVVICGCAARVYDYQYRDYHHWDGRERGYYEEWEVDTHRRHRDYDRRNENEQREYWQWRNSHHGHDHDRDHRDHDRGDNR